MPRLTEQEQQEIIRFIEAGKPLPDKYAFCCLRQTGSGTGLDGKTNEVCNIVLPFQVIEQVTSRAPKSRKSLRRSSSFLMSADANSKAGRTS